VHLLQESKAIADYVEQILGPGAPGKKAAALALAGKLYDTGSLMYPKKARVTKDEFLTTFGDVVDAVVSLHNLAGSYMHARKAGAHGIP
jgi:hypothetical protein